MLEEIGASAIYGAIGGGFGALIGAVLAGFFKNTQFYKFLSAALVAGFAVAGFNFAQPVLEPYIGKYLPASNGEQASEEAFASMFEELRSFPTIAAILDKEPDLQRQLQADLNKILAEENNIAIAKSRAFNTAYSHIQDRMVFYIARATDEDLLTFIKTSTEITDDMAVRAPRFCFDYYYNPTAMTNLTTEQLRENIGPEAFDRQQQEIAELVRNASSSIPAYDTEKVQAGVNQAAAVLQSLLGDKIGLVAGQMPEDDSDAKLACEATSALYSAILDMDDAAIISRHLFASQL